MLRRDEREELARRMAKLRERPSRGQPEILGRAARPPRMRLSQAYSVAAQAAQKQASTHSRASPHQRRRPTAARPRARCLSARRSVGVRVTVPKSAAPAHRRPARSESSRCRGRRGHRLRPRCRSGEVGRVSKRAASASKVGRNTATARKTSVGTQAGDEQAAFGAARHFNPRRAACRGSRAHASTGRRDSRSPSRCRRVNDASAGQRVQSRAADENAEHVFAAMQRGDDLQTRRRLPARYAIRWSRC